MTVAKLSLACCLEKKKITMQICSRNGDDRQATNQDTSFDRSSDGTSLEIDNRAHQKRTQPARKTSSPISCAPCCGLGYAILVQNGVGGVVAQ